MLPPVDPEWIRGPADELAVEQGCWFDAEAGERVVEFIETYCRQSKGRWAGQPLKLLDWQVDFLMRLFGWMGPDGLRRYRRAYLEVAKKNGKSTLISGVGLYLLLADGEGAPEVYLNACDREQAGIIFEEQTRMVAASPDLQCRLKVINSQNNKRIIDPAGNGAIIANSSVAGSKDGLNPSSTIFDELHRQPDRQLWDVFEYAGAAREQPLRISITTAGEDQEGVWHEEREYAEKVNDGSIPDITFLGVVYRALETDDLDDPETWRKANPSLGQTIRLDDFARELEEAKQLPIKLANFKRLRLNIIARGEGKFLAAGLWEACPSGPIVPEEFHGKPCFGGLDLASINDLAALVTIFGDPIAGFDVCCRFWLPEDDIVALERQHRVPYRTWADQGFIVLTSGPVIDYEFIRREIKEQAAEFDLKKLLIDPHNASNIGQNLQGDGLPVEFLRQGFISLNEPTKELLRLIIAGKIRHGGNPILRWMASNAVADTDAAGNIKLSKKKSRQKIDGMAALVNAIAGATSGNQLGGGSVYDERDLILL